MSERWLCQTFEAPVQRQVGHDIHGPPDGKLPPKRAGDLGEERT